MLEAIKKPDKFTIISVSLICLCVLSAFIPVVTAKDPSAPSWMKEGAYAKYTADTAGRISVFDTADPRFGGLNYLHNSGRHDIIEYSSASLTWRCISVNATTARLRVTFDYVGERAYPCNLGGDYASISLGGESDRRTGEVYVDIYTRAVYNVDGVFLGNTLLWLPANLRVNQEITIWETENETIKFSVVDYDNRSADEQANTPTIYIQQTEDVFWMNLYHDISGKSEMICRDYDLDTGVCLAAYLEWDPIMAAIGISRNIALYGEGFTGRWVYSNVFWCSDTNIDDVDLYDILNSEHTRDRTNWFDESLYVLFLGAVVWSLAAIVAAGIWAFARKFKKVKIADEARWYIRFYLLGTVVMLIIAYPIYLVIQSVEVTKIMIEVIVALLGFFSMITVYLLTSNGRRLDDLKKRLRKVNKPNGATQSNNESNEDEKKNLHAEILNVSESMKKTSSYMHNGFISFSASLASSILLLCIHIQLKEPLSRLISLLQAPRYYNAMHREFMYAEIASTSEFIMAILQILAGIIMMVSLFLGIMYLWWIIKNSRKEQEDTINELSGSNTAEPTKLTKLLQTLRRISHKIIGVFRIRPKPQ